MIVDAFRAELYKLSRNRGSAFWAFGFMPLFALGTGILEQLLGHWYFGDIIPFASPLQDSLNGLGTYSASIFQVCGIAGAAIIFSGEYRWETWRASLTRVDRIPIMIAKMLVFALAISGSLVLCSVARLVVGFLDAALTGTAAWPEVGAGEIILAHLLAFIATFLQMMVTAAFVMLVSVISRALSACIVATLLTLVALEVASIPGNAGNDPVWLLFPNIAGDAIRQAGQEIMLARSGRLAGYAPMAALPLIIEFFLLSAAALLLFARQDLSKE
jgi:ABC-2 type transport system permease protein